MSTINWWAVLVAGISSFVLGGVWYSPALFGNAWMKDNNLSMEEIKKGNFGKIYGIAFILSLVMSANLAMFLNDAKTDVAWGTIAGFLAGIWVLCAVATHGSFEHRPGRLIFINGGYSVVALMLMGAIIGLWR
ncbi:MAG: DUF1761 domain-containing protein [Panacibacter sp.]